MKNDEKDNQQEKKGFFKKRIDNVSRDVGVPILKDAATFMSGVVRGFFAVPSTEQAESFAQAKSRMNLSEADLAVRYKRFLGQFMIFLLAAFIMLAYGIYLFAELAILPGIMVLLLVAVFVMYAFRAHFWAFQIKHKKLGCTWKEWWDNKIDETKQDLIPK
jgi:intracellular multiplication protein IcmV